MKNIFICYSANKRTKKNKTLQNSWVTLLNKDTPGTLHVSLLGQEEKILLFLIKIPSILVMFLMILLVVIYFENLK